MRHLPSARPRVRSSVLAVALGAAVLALGCESGGGTDPWNVTSITVSPATAVLEVGETVRLSASIQSTGTPGATSWRSSRSSVALVDDQGLVTAISPGVAVVTASAGGREAGSTIQVTAPVPPAPGSVVAAASSDRTVEVTWADLSDFESGFTVERAEDGSESFVEAGTVDANVTGFTAGGLAPATTYRFRVSACNDSGCSAPSGPGSATTDASLEIVTETLASGVVAQPYDDAVEATGGGPQRAWAVTAGDLPPGLSLDAGTGEISGTPTTPGSWDFTIEATTRGQTAEAELSIDVTGTATLVARAFRDTDRDGVKDQGEAGVEGVEIVLVPEADPEVEVGATTGPDGSVEAAFGPGEYRVRVLPAGEWIGDPPVFADLVVELVEDGSVEVALPMVRGAQAEIGPDGGSVAGLDGVTLTVPAGALDEAQILSLLPVEVAFGGGSHPGVELHPDGLTFEGFAELTFPGGAGGSVFRLEGNEALGLASVVAGGAATTWTDHFSTYFYDAEWEGALTGSGTRSWTLVATPPLLASGTAGDAADDVGQGIARWNRVFAALGLTVSRNDADPDPAVRVDVRDLGPCAAAGTPGGRADTRAAFTHGGTLYLNERCAWSTSDQLARGATMGVALEGAVAHQLGHLLGLPHHAAATCEPAGTADPCVAPPTMAVRGPGDLGPLWPGDFALAAAILGLSGDVADGGVAGVSAVNDWVDEQELEYGEALGTAPGVKVVDESGDPVPDATVVFRILGGGGAVTDPVVRTGSDGVARVGAWSLGTSTGAHLLGASVFLRPDQAAANEAVGAQVTFRVTMLEPPPLLVEDFLDVSVGDAFTYAFEDVPKDGSPPTTGTGTDQVVAETQDGSITWYELDGDGPLGAYCGDATCALGLDPAEGQLFLRAVGSQGGVIRVRVLKEPIEVDATWQDVIVIVAVGWRILDISENVDIRGTVWERVVEVRGSQSGTSETIVFSFGQGLGPVRVVADGLDTTVTYELISVTSGAGGR